MTFVQKNVTLGSIFSKVTKFGHPNVLLARSWANWKYMWMKQYGADSSLLPGKDMWFLLEGKLVQWIYEVLKYWYVYLLFCLNAVFSALKQPLLLALDFQMLMGVYLHFFCVLIMHFHISFSLASIFIAIALRIWTRKKFDKIWTCESDGFLLLPRASFGKPSSGMVSSGLLRTWDIW